MKANVPSLTLTKLAVAGLVGHPARPSLLVWVDPGTSPRPELGRIKEALRFEVLCLRALIENTPVSLRAPAAPFPLDATQLAELLDVDRVLCAVAETDAGDLLAMRDYQGLGAPFLLQVSEELAQITAQMPDPVLAAASLSI